MPELLAPLIDHSNPNPNTTKEINMSYEEFAQIHADAYSNKNLAGLLETEPAETEDEELEV